jgi:hypothetical protein
VGKEAGEEMTEIKDDKQTIHALPYVVATGTSIRYLEANVEIFMAMNYVPTGGICVTAIGIPRERSDGGGIEVDNYFYQAMILKSALVVKP